MSNFQRELISRATAGVVGVALLYGGWKCVAKGLAFADEMSQSGQRASVRSVRRGTNASALPLLVGGVMLIVGTAIGGIAVVPTRWIDKVYRVSPPQTSDRDTASSSRNFSNWV